MCVCVCVCVCGVVAGNIMMNLNINILTKKGFTNLDIFLYYFKFQKITKTVLMAVTEEATEIFL